MESFRQEKSTCNRTVASTIHLAFLKEDIAWGRCKNIRLSNVTDINFEIKLFTLMLLSNRFLHYE